MMAKDTYFYYFYSSEAVCFQDSEFHGGWMESDYPSINLTNCLLERVIAYLFPSDSSTPVIRNCLFWHGTFGYCPFTSTGNAIVADNLFDQTTIPDWMGGLGATYSGGYNAYITNCDKIDPTKTGDIILASPLAYQSSFFGNYYQPPTSPLINHGSTTADLVGLYHYTVQTNQVPETNSVVDIGYHYVATDAYGNPLDTNGDGIPDYLEDVNGNGLVDSGEIGWNIFGDPGLSIIITRPRNGSSLP